MKKLVSVSRGTSSDAHSIPVALAQFDSLPDSKFVRIGVVQALEGDVSPATIWRRVQKGLLPAPWKIGPNTTAWRVGDLRRAQAARAQAAGAEVL
ncbi:MAG: transcriptional regulator [Burkholderiaceae bacterium]|nr:transcriptional regulator [Burkholderiaceae bacterium]